jgi:hypothetical protein
MSVDEIVEGKVVLAGFPALGGPGGDPIRVRDQI